MAKPSTLLGVTAASATPAGGTDPGSKKTTGWAPTEKVAAQHFNWLWRVVSSWIDYLDGLTGEGLSWSAKHTFTAGLLSGADPAGPYDVLRLSDLLPTVGWTSLSPASGWSANVAAQYRKDCLGVVRLRGVLAATAGGTGSQAVLAALPVGCRPTLQHNAFFAVAAGETRPCLAQITTGGVVQMTNSYAAGTLVYLDGITFLDAGS